ncbi:MAG: 2Fe-2S iron-sulfur cluster-binding protein [Candidatus Firestonebacteria bacterium]
MIEIEINNNKIKAGEGWTILRAAEEAGFKIPTLCYYKETGAITSCFVCVVEVKGAKNLLPACTAEVKPGMEVFLDTDRVKLARKAALELLLSDHNGDCEGPCRIGCPANIESPKFISEILHKKYKEALITIKKSVPLPAVLGRVCPELCEKGCRRAKVDEPVAICHLHRFVADLDLETGSPYHPEVKEPHGKKAAIIGAGPAGISCAYYLRPEGYEVTIFDGNEKPGGGLRYGVSRETLPERILDGELKALADMGVKFNSGKRLGRDLRLADLLKEYGAVFIATGSKPEDLAAVSAEGIKTDGRGILVNRQTLETNIKGVFAGGDCVIKSNLAVRSMAAGRLAAGFMAGFLRGEEAAGEKKLFSVRMNPLKLEDLQAMMHGVSGEKRYLKSRVDGKQVKLNPGEARKSFTEQEALSEAGRCMRCDCRKLYSCRLKKHSEACGADWRKYDGKKKDFEQDYSHPFVAYQSGKCITCGICIKVAEKHKETLGLTFLGRGFAVKMAAPFNSNMKKALSYAAEECIANCPTGALSR